jgi:hypothetical protein
MLITANDIRKYRSIALNLDDEKRLNTYIDEAEKLDTMPAIGVRLYKDINDNPANHIELLSGGYYDNEKRYFAGLKAAICMLAYYRFSLNNAVNITSFGVQRKIAIDSEPIDDKTLFRHANEAKNIGFEYLQQCVDYINFNENHCNNIKSIKPRKFKIIGQ